MPDDAPVMITTCPARGLVPSILPPHVGNRMPHTLGQADPVPQRNLMGPIALLRRAGASGDFIVYSADAANAKATQDMLQSSFGDPNKVTVKIVAYPAADFVTQFQNAVRSGTEVDGLILNGQNVTFLQSKGLLSPI